MLCPGPIDTDVARSDRNRPKHLSAHQASALEDRFWKNLSARLASGMHPDQVGEMVLDAVRHERFWILTHPAEFMPALEKRLESIRRDNVERMS